MNCELISVIMTVYNSDPNFLRAAIKSVINQTYKNFEFIIVDDGSTSEIVNIVLSEFENNDLKVIKQKNAGLCNARNRGLEEVKGKYVAFIDDDDVWYSNKLEECYKFFCERKLEDSKVGMVFSQASTIDEKNNIYGTFGFKVKGNIYKKILGKNIIGPPSSVFIDKAALDSVGYFDSEYIYGEDIELWYRLTKEYSVYSINKPLIQYRYRLNSLSKNYRKMGFYTEKALLKALSIEDTFDYKNSVLSKYYIDFACLYFSNNDKEFFIKYYKKAVKYDKKSIFNLKLLMGLLISLLGQKVMISFNEKRRAKDIIPPSYLEIHDCTGV